MINSNEVNEQKKSLRKLVKQRKAEYSFAEMVQKSDTIFAQVEKLPEFLQAKCIFAYMALGDEVQTQSFIKRWVATKRIVLPIVKGDDLELREYTMDGALTPGESFGIMEPHNGRLVDLSEIDLAIIPGVAFDKQGNRMGRGKGYYDKLLTDSAFYKIGVCFDFQLFENVPVDSFDVKMDAIIIA